MLRAVLVVCALAGCVSSDVSVCDNGVVCPAGQTCAVVNVANTPTPYCVTPQQACSANGSACATASTCHDGVCLTDQCGNQLEDASEACDDGNLVAGDGCSATCDSDETCGNGVVDGDEVCDCGDADRASASPLCAQTINGGTVCSESCTGRDCGDGVEDPGEVCDDGNLTSGDNCSSDCMSEEVCGNEILDAVDGETCDFGDQLGHDGCTSTCGSEVPEWTRLANVLPRYDGALAYDARRRRTVVFGGGVSPNALGYDTDTFEWNGKRWTLATTQFRPSPRVRHAMAFDAKREQIVMFGGNSGARDTWTYDGRGWTVQTPSFVPPSRSHPTMVYDAKNERIVMFGGTQVGVYTNKTYVWDGTNWSELVTNTPPAARTGHAMAYDANRQVIVMFGGNNPGPLDDQVWELDGATWTNKTFGGTRPTARSYSAMAYEPGSRQVMLAGGGSTNPGQSDAWLWDGTSWTTATPLPFNVYAHAMTTDGDRARVVLLDNNGTVFEFSSNAWTAAGGTTANGPPPRYQAAGATNPLRQQLVIYGGGFETAGGVNLYSDTWYWSGSWYSAATPPAMNARRRARMVFDPIRRELVMFGGCDATTGRFAETWVFTYADDSDPGHWEQRGGTQPPARCDHQMAWDGVRGRVIVYGGNLAASDPFTDQWSWNGSAWSLDTASAPPEMMAGVAAWDPIRQHVVHFGGARASQGFAAHDETWTWNGTAWTQYMGATRPSSRFDTALAWDPARKQLVLYGGGGPIQADAFAWDGKWVPLPTINTPTGRVRSVGASSPDGAGIMIVFGQNTVETFPSQMLGDTLRLRYEGAEVDETCTVNDTDLDGLAGCADPDCWRVCTPLCMPGVSGCPTSPRCGDGACGVLEARDSCPSDC